MLRILPAIALVATAGCIWDPPDNLPLVDEVPIVPSNECQPPREERVECVIDGDTIAVGSCDEETGERIRMLGINTPEVAKGEEPGECFGDVSEEFTRRLLEGQNVLLTFDKVCEGTFGRTLAYVWLDYDDADGSQDNLFNLDLDASLDEDDFVEGEEEADLDELANLFLVNELLLLEGYARLFDEEASGFQEPRLSADLERAEAVARARRLGLWGACDDEER